MHRLIAAALACLLLAACTTTNTKLALGADVKPPSGARVLLLQPEVQLALLTAGGVQEPRADWSKAARSNLSKELESQLKTRAHSLKVLDADSVMEGRQGQLLRLHEAVGQSVLLFNYGPFKLPTKKGFDWTLGQGAQTLATQHQADYALFVQGQGTYASGARIATAIGMSLLGVSVPLGQQQVFASLVDLKTGKVVWFNVATAGPQADMREAAGAESLTTSLLKNVPL
jgi:hypothetical protein